ncbi:MAG: S9 family peptidase [Sphingomonas sanxanigenens]|uniref:S9 family peptidase n=1 Tax=Sphingomonas sanxanigenens TaxID=397260 RepID=A0A2W5C554_9SPHN|nr:MAG: S9 family peptidase [Sphingomonas sanxanigenens]
MTDPKPPVAARKPHVSTRFGVTRQDPYHWLRDPGYPEVKDKEILGYLEAENAYFESRMAPHQGTVDTLFAEMKGRIKEDDSSVPAKDGAFVYWRSFDKGAQYRKWWRRPAAGGPDELILDETALAEGKAYFRLGAMDISDDDRILAYSTDSDGSERFTIRFRDLQTGAPIDDAIEGARGKWGEDSIEGTLGNIVFAADNLHLLYGLVDEHWRTRTIKAHRLGTPSSEDRVVYHEEDIGYSVGVSLSGDRKWLLLTASEHMTSETRLIPADDPFAEPILIAARQTGREYDVDIHGDDLLIRTNDTHPNFRLVTAPIAAPGDWREAIAPSEDFYLTDVSCFADFYVTEGRDRGLDQIELRDYATHAAKRIDFPEASYVAGLDENPEYATRVLRLSYESMVTPDTVVDYDVDTAAMTVLKVQEIPSGYDRDRYATERLEIVARDGTAIPVSIVYAKDFAKDGKGALHLYAYGAYGYAIAPGFSTARLSLLDRGMAYAIAHIRGGDDLGYRWYLDGKLEKRTNTFNDFVDVTRGLIALGYAAEGRVTAAGRSAGGELMGAIVNQAPELYGAVIADVPFVDVLDTMLDETLPLTPGEWPEWGNPITDEKAFHLILSYSPYDNVTAQAYPPMLISGGLNDPRVTYWEPAKWAAKLRATKTDDNILLLKTNMGAGHGGKSGRFESLREEAEEMAFILWQIGLEN